MTTHTTHKSKKENKTRANNKNINKNNSNHYRSFHLNHLKPDGIEILNSSFLNKGTAFTMEERKTLGLIGLLPPGIKTLDQQATHAYEQYLQQSNDLEKNVFLTALQDRNEVLFYKLLSDHMHEMFPIVYDPTVGLAIKNYSHIYRRPRGLYLSIDHPELIEESFQNLRLGPNDVDLIVATDAEEILGIGDWGVGGIDIAVGKLAIYTAAAGVNPRRTIPVMLDVGTNRESLLNDPTYLGNHHSRIRGQQYDNFIDLYVKAATKFFPHAVLHWEDFGPGNGRRILEKYRDKVCTFDDDMQGTGAITLAALFSAVPLTGIPFKEHRVVIFGSGTAGVGVADQIRDTMMHKGLSMQQAIKQIWCIDKQGLLTDNMGTLLRDYQIPYARPTNEISHWQHSGLNGEITLADVIHEVHPTILIGTSTKGGAFTKEIVKEMAAHTKHPIIFPLSNPTELAEATPSNLIEWTNGRALITTGSPFNPVTYKKTTYTIGQSNNALLYPGLGLGAIVSRAKKISNKMLSAAAYAVASLVDAKQPGASLLPQVENLRTVSASVAVAVAKTAIEEGLARRKLMDITEEVENFMWQPHYQNDKK